MNTISWKPKALKQLEKIKEIAMRQRIYTERRYWLISRIVRALKS